MSFACCDKLCLWLCCVKQSVIKGNIKKKKTKQPKKTIFITDLGNDLRRQAYEVCDSGKRKKLMFVLYDSQDPTNFLFSFKVVLHKWRMRVTDLG